LSIVPRVSSIRLRRLINRLTNACPGDWLRIERDRDSPLGNYVRQNYSHVTIDPLVTEYVACKIRDATHLHTGIVVDGFPRTSYQVSKPAQ